MNRDRQVLSTGHPITFPLYLSSDHITPSIGTIPSVFLAKNGGPWQFASGVVSEMGSGWYAFAGNAWDRDSVGELSIQATGLNTDRYNGLYSIVPFDPYDGSRLGLSSIPVGAAGSQNGIPTLSEIPTVSGIWGYTPRYALADSGDYAYYAEIQFFRNSLAAKDEYTVDWFRNTLPMGSGQIGSPTIQVLKRADGSNLIGQSGMQYISTAIGTTRYDEYTNRIGVGDAYIAVATASIDGSTRTWQKLIGRDG